MTPTAGGRRDDAARDAIELAATQYADDAGVLPPPVLDVSGPCIRGTHHACPITADGGRACACYCHAPGAWGEQ